MPRKTAKKPTTRKAAPKKAAPKRKKYQTGGTTKSQMPRSQALALARAEEERRMQEEMLQEEMLRDYNEAMAAEERRIAEERERERNSSMRLPTYRTGMTDAEKRREEGLTALGNRQRAAANRARAQRPVQSPSRAQRERNLREYNAAMAARQANLSRGSTPSPRPRPVRSGPNVNNTTQAQYQEMLRQRRIGAAPASQPPVRTQPAQPPVRDPNPRAGNVFTQQMQAERSRIQQQIAQLQARLRQLGG